MQKISGGMSEFYFFAFYTIKAQKKKKNMIKRCPYDFYDYIQVI